MNNILLWFRRHENIYKFALRVIVVFIILLLSVALLGMLWLMISVMLDSDIKADFMGYTGYSEKDKPELIKLIGLGMSGIIATLGVVGLLRRAASVDEQNKLTEKGHIHERFRAATEHIGNEKSVSTRIASFNEFYHIAEIELDLRKTIFDILCAHLRQTTKHEDYKNNLKPTEEVQSLLDILFKPKNKNILIFSGLEANLAEANLQRADMYKANLQYAKMKGVNLQSADLQSANLQSVNLQSANLQDADLQSANLQGANLQDANLQEADLLDANLQRAYLLDANLQKAYLLGADLQSAYLLDANLQDAKIQSANLQKANLEGANLQGANLLGAQINRETTVMPDNWKDVVKLYDNEDG